MSADPAVPTASQECDLKPKLSITTTLPPATPPPMSAGKQPLALNFELTPELIAVGSLVATMKKVIGVLSGTFDALDEQSGRVASLAPTLKAAEHLKKLRAQLEKQLADQKLRAVEMRQLLDEAVNQSLSEHVKAHVRATLAPQVRERVAEQLNVQVPEHLRQKIKTHKRQIFEVQRSLHNSQARQHNATLGPDSLTEELRPLLRPLPTSEQSPMPHSDDVPPPSESDTFESVDETPPTASPLFPRDLQTLFALKSEEAETLVREYKLDDVAVPTTPIDSPAPSEAAVDVSRERNLNKFMAHIGVSRRFANSRLPRLQIVIPGGEQVAFVAVAPCY
uniref:Uncharacterized protein n=1 Tax=Mycena chlorophos TaxID=658473 RepID=A0ABQ0M3D8_MYCCL|nr:predicted protein [Mycena chlorophos]